MSATITQAPHAGKYTRRRPPALKLKTSSSDVPRVTKGKSPPPPSTPPTIVFPQFRQRQRSFFDEDFSELPCPKIYTSAVVCPMAVPKPRTLALSDSNNSLTSSSSTSSTSSSSATFGVLGRCHSELATLVRSSVKTGISATRRVLLGIPGATLFTTLR